MRDIANLALRLFALMLIAGLALGATDALTREPIAKQQALQAETMRRAVLPEAESFEETTAPEGISAAYAGVQGGQTVGYVFEITTAGFGGDLPVTVGISSDGKIEGVRIGTNSETAGLGAKSTNESFYGQYAGKDASTLTVVKNAPSGQQIQAITAATITSTAATNAVNLAIEAFQNMQ